MAKLITTDLSNLNNPSTVVSTINANNAKIETAMENTLSRDGTSPNSMGASLDMNSNKILNLPAPSSNTEPVRLADVSTLISDQVGTPAVTNRVVATRDSLADLSTTDNHVAYLREAGREGIFVFDSSNLSTEVSDDTEQGAYVAPSTDTTGAHGAWVKKFNRPPRPEDFGGKDFAAADGCRRYAQRETGEMEFGPSTYELNDDLIIDSSIKLSGVRGKTLLDFSSRTGFANNSTSGLIRVLGSQGTGVALSTSVRERNGFLPIAGSGTIRSGVMTIGSGWTPHGLSVGDPVWHICDVLEVVPSGEEDFYSLRKTQNNLALTKPFIVTSVVDDTHYTVSVPNADDANLTSNLLRIMYASDCLVLPDVSSFTPGQKIILGSEARRAVPGTTESVRIGEHQTIARVLADEKMLILHTAARDRYLTSDSAKVFPLTMIDGCEIRDMTIKGSGPNTDTGTGQYGDRAIFCDLVDSPKITGVTFTDVDQMGVLTRRCRNVEVTHNSMTFNASNEAGREDGNLDIQYAFADDSSEGGVCANNYVQGGRHAWDQSGTSISGVYGVARHWTVRDNYFFGQWWAAIATHQSIDRLIVTGNHIWDAHTGVNIRYCKDVSIQGNEIRAFQYAAFCYNYVGNLEISDNPLLDGGIAPVYIHWAFATDANATFTGPVKIKNNTLIGGVNGVLIEDPYQNRNFTGEIDGNSIASCSGIPIDIAVSPSSTTDDNAGFHGSVSRNNIRHLTPGDGATITAAIRISNARGATIKDNVLDLPESTFNYGILLLNKSNGAWIGGTDFKSNLPSIARVSIANGNTHRGPDVPPQVYTIKDGAITIPDGVTSIVVDTEGNSASDNLDTINGLIPGRELVIRSSQAAHVVNVRDAGVSGGNIQTTGGRTVVLDSSLDTLVLRNTATTIVQVSFNDDSALEATAKVATTTDEGIARFNGTSGALQNSTLGFLNDNGCFSSTKVTIADDGVASFTLPTTGCLVFLSTDSVITPCPIGMIYARPGASPTVRNLAVFSTTNTTFTDGTSAPTGTTGSDGNITLACDSTKFYFENRSGTSKTYILTFLGKS